MSTKGMNMNKITLNNLFIKEYVKENKIKSLSRLAGEIGISRSMLCKILQGKRNPGRKVITKMLIYFKVPFDILFTMPKE
ncbi:helix-turn-helix transcriptional regulator [Brevibacillus porteri]|uniref:helix-turn-helix domain-containing protein n=1 Tax=Brevibacillus porteri TaxID=2126350 RepID=UPI003D1DCD94